MTIAPHKNCETPRYREISKLRAYYDGEQYRGRPDWWTGEKDGQEVPLHERAPCIVYPMPKIAVNRVVDFTFGETHFPTLSVEEQDDDEEDGYSVKLDDAEAETLEKGVGRLAKIFRARIAKLMREGLSCRTAVALLSLRRGKFHIEVPKAEECLLEWEDGDPSSGRIVKLTWVYQYEKTVQEGEQLVAKRFWFRRDVDAIGVTDYEPVEVKDKRAPKWTPKPVDAHGLGFCPVLCIRNGVGNPSDPDGVSLYDGLFNELDALNFSLSQRHRGIRFHGTGQIWETGVEPGKGPAADGRRSRRGYSAANAGTQIHGEVAGSDEARKLAPDAVWTYEDEKARLGMLETTGKAFEVTSLHVADIRKRLAETMSVVLADVDDTLTKGGGGGAGGLNAKLLAMLYAPMISLVEGLRDEVWWPQGLLTLLSMALRMLAVTGGKGVLMPGAAKLAKVAQKFAITVEGVDGVTWIDPPIVPLWGDNFSPSNDEITSGVNAAKTAKEGGIISGETATKFVASYFRVEDVEGEQEDIAEEKTEAMAQAVEAAQATDGESDGPAVPAKKPARAPKAKKVPGGVSAPPAQK